VTDAARKAALARVKKIAVEARYLAVLGRALDPTTLATLVAALADEVAKILAAPPQSPRNTSKRKDR
jgi:hypothetical protein